MKGYPFIHRLIRRHPCDCEIAWCLLDDLLRCRVRWICDRHDNWIIRGG